jgi:hypothetical protein
MHVNNLRLPLRQIYHALRQIETVPSALHRYDTADNGVLELGQVLHACRA